MLLMILIMIMMIDDHHLDNKQAKSADVHNSYNLLKRITCKAAFIMIKATKAMMLMLKQTPWKC